MLIRFAAPLAALLLVSPAALAVQPTAADPALAKAVASPTRSAQAATRDRYRHPAEELTFFGVKPDMHVIEIWPAPGYWTEILAPYLHDHGSYTAAMPRAGANFGNVKTVAFNKDQYEIAPAGSADMVLTFRNVHNWMAGGWSAGAFSAFYKALKPGGILGVEEHRARTDKPQDPSAQSGYVRQDYAIALAEKAGFKFLGSSEINANPKDTADWPAGVWTLPPTLQLGDKDREKYVAIGEADNFVLKFQKPAN